MQPSTQYSFVEAAYTTAGCQTGGVANVTTLDSAPVGQAPPSSSIPIPLPCPSNGMLGPSNPTMSSLPTPCPIESPALSPSQRCGHLLGRCRWMQQYQNLQQWSVAHCELQNSSVMLSLYVGASVVQSPPVTYVMARAPDRFDAVSVQNVGSTYIIVSWDLPTDSNGILINFSLYCNGALAGVLPFTVISYNTTSLLPFTLYMYMICAQYGICWTGPPVTPACTALQLERSVGRHQCCSQPAQCTSFTVRMLLSKLKLALGSFQTIRNHDLHADILLQNWNLGRPVALDISVVSPLNPSTLAEAGATFGAVLETTESRKHQANDEKCSALGWVSTPLAVDSYGAWGKEASLFLAQVAARLAIHKSLPKSQASFDLFSNLSICFRANARAILRRV
ncbi:hypothetical protein EMCRGX_G027062 [Ephydatia muelleri]